jgi:TfoX/Sxy family transcriptional regulator of competence genes
MNGSLDNRDRRSHCLRLLPREDAGVAYDEDLANRIRELIAGDLDVTEQRMFGGLAFLVGGNMSVAASGQGGLMVRVDPEDTDALLAEPHARPFEMRGRPMRGWLRVEAEGVRTKRQLEPWVKPGWRTRARSLRSGAERARSSSSHRFSAPTSVNAPGAKRSGRRRGA